MPLFRYAAVNPAGSMVNGTRAGDTVADIEEWLLKNRMTPLDIIVAEGGEGQHAGFFRYLKERFSPVSLEDRILFCRQTSTLFDAGIPVLRIFETMKRQAEHPRLKGILEDVHDQVEAGSSLSDAFSRHRKVFDPLFINLVQVGEESGTLAQCFGYLAALYENEKEVRERIKTATRYPKIVIGALFLAISFLMTFVVPKFVRIFQSSRVELPLPTKVLVAVSSLFSNYIVFILIAVAIMISAYVYAMRHERPRALRDAFLLRVPVMGVLSLKIFMSRFCRVFSVLLRSGVEIIRTIDLSGNAMGNSALRKMVSDVREDVRNGVSLDEAMGKHSQFPPLVLQMVSAGVESGQLDALMDKVADYYETESDYTIKNLSTLIEPLLLAVLGVVVGFIALAIFLPMWSMMDVMRGG